MPKRRLELGTRHPPKRTQPESGWAPSLHRDGHDDYYNEPEDLLLKSVALEVTCVLGCLGVLRGLRPRAGPWCSEAHRPMISAHPVDPASPP